MLGRSRIHTRARGSGAGAGSTTTTDLQRILALSPSLLIWPANGAGWQGTSGGTLAASGQPLGLGADLSQLQGKTLSEWLAAPTTSELVTNGGFDSDTDWTKGIFGTVSAATISGGLLNLPRVDSGNFAYAYQTLPATTSVVVLTIVCGANAIRVRVGNAALNGSVIDQNAAANATTTFIVYVSGTNRVITLFNNDNASTGTVDNISVRELPGNHLRAGTWASPSDSARGTLLAGGALQGDGVGDTYEFLNPITISTAGTIVLAVQGATVRGSNGQMLIGSGPVASSNLFYLWDNVGSSFWRNRLLTSNEVLGIDCAQSGAVTSLNDLAPHVITLVRSSTTNFDFYFDGALAATTTSSNTAAFTLRAIIGTYGTSYYSDAKYTLAAVFQSALTPPQLLTVHQIAAGTNGAVLA